MEIKLDKTTLPADGIVVMVESEKDGTFYKATYASEDQLFVVSPQFQIRAWDAVSWVYEDEYEELSECCSAEIIMESRICSACKEHC